MPREVERELEQIASTEKVSINSLVNKALRKFVDWDYYAEDIGLLSPPRQILLFPVRWEVFARLMIHASDQEAARLGRWAGRNVFREFTIYWFKEFSVGTALKTQELVGSRYGRSYSCSHNIAGKEYVVTLNHGMGPKWSIFHACGIRTVFGELLGKKVKITQLKNKVVARIPE